MKKIIVLFLLVCLSACNTTSKPSSTLQSDLIQTFPDVVEPMTNPNSVYSSLSQDIKDKLNYYNIDYESIGHINEEIEKLNLNMLSGETFSTHQNTNTIYMIVGSWGLDWIQEIFKMYETLEDDGINVALIYYDMNKKSIEEYYQNNNLSYQKNIIYGDVSTNSLVMNYHVFASPTLICINQDNRYIGQLIGVPAELHAAELFEDSPINWIDESLIELCKRDYLKVKSEYPAGKINKILSFREADFHQEFYEETVFGNLNQIIDFDAFIFYDKTVQIDDFKNQKILLNIVLGDSDPFFKSAEYLKTIEKISAVYPEYKIMSYYITMGESLDDFLNTTDLPLFGVTLDEWGIQSDLGLNANSLIMINEEGRVAGCWIGNALTLDLFHQLNEFYFGEKPVYQNK